MKKIIILFAFAIIAILPLSAQTTTANDFIGRWSSTETTAQMVIWKDVDGSFQMVVWNKSDGEELEISNLKVENTVLTTTLTTISTKWVIQCTFTITDSRNLREEISGKTESTLYWKKMK